MAQILSRMDRPNKAQQKPAGRIAPPTPTIMIIPYLWRICFEYARPTLLKQFQDSCQEGRLADAQWLWSRGFTLSDVRYFDNTALFRAYARGHLDIMQWLWSLGLVKEDLKLVRSNLYGNRYLRSDGPDFDEETLSAISRWVQEIDPDAGTI